MKFREKKTGKIQTCDMVVITDEKIDGEIASLNRHTFIFRSIEQFNDECEAYKPKEPLIKDENVRETVRAWAKALGLQEVYCASNGYEIYGGIDDYVIQFDGEPFPFADKNKIYTIAELCGEEEAPEPIEPTFIDLDERIKEKEEE